jgi:hypothetical protein
VISQNSKGVFSNFKYSGVIFQSFLPAFLSGLIGFIIFFAVLVFIRFFDHVIGYKIFAVEMEDILLSSIGFLCLFMLSFLKHFTKRNQ